MGQQKQSFWDSIKQKASETGKTVTQKTTEAAKKKASQIGETVSQQAAKAGKTVQDKATEVKDSIAHQATAASKNIMETATESVESVTKTSQNWIPQKPNDRDDIDGSATVPDWSLDELYHVFLGSQLTETGGSQTVTLKTGKSYEVKIPPRQMEGSHLRLKGCGLQGNDVFLVLHTLVNPYFNIDRRINQLIAQAPIYDRSKIRCLEAYNQMNSTQGIDDIAALELLDYLVSFSKLNTDMGQHYTIASQNARLIRLKSCLETALSASNLSKTEQQSIKATFQYLVAGEAVPNLQTLTSLDTIILNASLHRRLKQYYLYHSVTSRMMTLDLIMVHAINQSTKIQPHDRERWLSVYTIFREDKAVMDAITLNEFEQWLPTAPLPSSCKTVYQLMRHHRLELNEEFEPEDYIASFKLIQSVLQSFQNNKPEEYIAENKSINVMEIPSKTLAENHYQSVARGGLGLLGGGQMIRNVNLFLEMATRLAITQVCLINSLSKVNLGIPAINSSLKSSVAGTSWQAVGNFGISQTDISQLSESAAYQAILEEVGGITGFITAVEASKRYKEKAFLNPLKNKLQQQQLIKDLETKMYS
ncbi:MAG: hypothetical protein WBA77_12415 [Microcoleaceae cyanobacterium]